MNEDHTGDLDKDVEAAGDRQRAEALYRTLPTRDLELLQRGLALDLAAAARRQPKARQTMAFCEGRLEIIARLLRDRKDTERAGS